MDVARRGILIGFTLKFGSGSYGVSIGWKLNGNTTLPITTTKDIGTP
jgi:hypothetical protein